MANCKSCGDNWNLKTVLRRYATMTPEMPCPSCGKNQYLSKKYRERSMLSTLLIPLLILMHALFSIQVEVMAVLFIGAFLVIIAFHLFALELDSEEEDWRNSLYH